MQGQAVIGRGGIGRTIVLVVVGIALAVAAVTAVVPMSAHAAGASRHAAHPTHPARPVLAAPVIKGGHVVLSGRAQPRVLVRVQGQVGRKWKVLTKIRAARSGRFRATAPAPARPQAVRVVARGRTSTVRTVVPPITPPAPTPTPAPTQTVTPTPTPTPTPTATPTPTPTPDPVASRPAPTDACGAQPLKDDGSRWQCSFVDDFDGTSLDTSRWVASELPGNGGSLCYASSPQTIAVSDGELRLSVVPTGSGTVCPARADGTRATYAGASISTWHTFGQQYGRFEARMRVPVVNGPGLHSAFWLWPDTRTASDAGWPLSGEIDIAELYSSYPDLVVPFLHYSDDALGAVQGLNTTTKASAPRGEWHTYTLTWTADQVSIAVDGQTILTNTAGAATFRKAFILNFSQLLGAGTNAWTGSVALPSAMEVDYVKVWK